MTTPLFDKIIGQESWNRNCRRVKMYYGRRAFRQEREDYLKAIHEYIRHAERIFARLSIGCSRCEERVFTDACHCYQSGLQDGFNADCNCLDAEAAEAERQRIGGRR